MAAEARDWLRCVSVERSPDRLSRVTCCATPLLLFRRRGAAAKGGRGWKH